MASVSQRIETRVIKYENLLQSAISDIIIIKEMNRGISLRVKIFNETNRGN